MENLNIPVICTYTRKQAIEDGVLIDVSQTAKEAGFRYPVAVTNTLWGRYIEPPTKAKTYGQSVEGRLWDVVWLCRVRATKAEGSRFEFQVIFQDGPAPRDRHTPTLIAVCGPGDHHEPVVTIMLPEDD